MEFKSMKDLEKYLQSQINNSLQQDVAPIVKETMSAEIQNTVYAEYPNPHMYNRRKSGGLESVENMNIDESLINSGVLSITNDTPFDDRYDTENSGDGLAGLIEFGDGYDGHTYDYTNYNGNSPYLEPRPFIQNSRDTLKQTGAHIKALKKGLKKSGINVE